MITDAPVFVKHSDHSAGKYHVTYYIIIRPDFQSDQG